METWSSSVTTTFQVPNTNTNPINPTFTHHRLKPSPLSHHHHSATAKTIATSSSSSSYRPSSPRKDNFTPLYSNYSQKPSPLLGPNFRAPPSSVHRRAASGYAAALLDIAQSNGVVLEVGRDVRRLLRLLRNNGQVKELMMDGLVEEREKGEAIVELVEMGKFEGHLVGLVKMVIRKGKTVEMVKEAMEEFERIIYHLAPVSVLAPAT